MLSVAAGKPNHTRCDNVEEHVGPGNHAAVGHPKASLPKECNRVRDTTHPPIHNAQKSKPPSVPFAERCLNGSLRDVLRRGAVSPGAAALLTWKLRLHMAMEAAKGLEHLHSRLPTIVHGGLKSSNVLVDEHWHVKVGNGRKRVSRGSWMAHHRASRWAVVAAGWL